MPSLDLFTSLMQPWISEWGKGLNLAIGRAHLVLLQLSYFLSLQKAEQLLGAALSSAPIVIPVEFLFQYYQKTVMTHSVKYKILKEQHKYMEIIVAFWVSNERSLSIDNSYDKNNTLCNTQHSCNNLLYRSNAKTHEKLHVD